MKENKDRNDIKNKRGEKGHPILSASILVVALSIAGGSLYVYHQLFHRKTEGEYEDDLEKTNATIKNNSDIISILNNNDININKKQFLSNVLNYLYDYNSSFANRHIDKKTSTKPAHKVSEIVAQQLIYNNYDKNTLGEIFGYYDFNPATLYNSYIAGLEQERMAYVIQIETLNKTNLLKRKAKKIYNKYEALNIEFNIQTNKERKKEIANTFFTELRNDIDFENIEDIEIYKTSILPIVEAMVKKCQNVNIDNILNNDELQWLVNTCLEKAKDKLKAYESKISSVSTTNKALGIEDNIPFKLIEDTIEKELTKKGLYITNDNERDFSNHKDYRKAISLFKENKKNSVKDNHSNDNKITTSKKKYESKENNESSNSKAKKKTSDKQSEDNNNNDDGATNNNDDENNNENTYTENNDSNNGDDKSNSNDSKDDSSYEDHIKDITTDPSGAVDSNESLPDPNQTKRSISKTEIADIIVENIANSSNNTDVITNVFTR